LCIPNSTRDQILSVLTNAANSGPVSGVVNQISQFGVFLPIFVTISIVLTLM